jgi:hypothetical protein
MPYCQPAEIFFTVLIGALSMALLLLTLREDLMRSRSR